MVRRAAQMTDSNEIFATELRLVAEQLAKSLLDEAERRVGPDFTSWDVVDVGNQMNESLSGFVTEALGRLFEPGDNEALLAAFRKEIDLI
jgi:hypothetical protein